MFYDVNETDKEFLLENKEKNVHNALSIMLL